MKKLFLNIENTYALDDADVTEDSKVHLAIIGEDGSTLMDSQGRKLLFSNEEGDEGTLAFGTDGTKLAAIFTFAATTPTQYARAYWIATDAEGAAIDMPQYYPEELSVEASIRDLTQTHAPMVCPASYFLDAYMGAMPSFSRVMVQIVKELTDKNPDIVRNQLLSSQDFLEREIRSKFFLTKFHVDRDFYAEEFYANYWLQQVDWVPLHSVDSYKLVYGNQNLELSNDIAASMTVNKELGTIEWLPTSVNGNLFTLIMTSVAGLAATQIAAGQAQRIPNLLRIDYTAGMDFPTLEQSRKENIRQAVCRNAFMALKPLIDPIMRERSISTSIDGASKSKSGGMDSIIKQFQGDETAWIASMRRQLGTNIAMGIA